MSRVVAPISARTEMYRSQLSALEIQVNDLVYENDIKSGSLRTAREHLQLAQMDVKIYKKELQKLEYELSEAVKLKEGQEAELKEEVTRLDEQNCRLKKNAIVFKDRVTHLANVVNLIC